MVIVAGCDDVVGFTTSITTAVVIKYIRAVPYAFTHEHGTVTEKWVAISIARQCKGEMIIIR